MLGCGPGPETAEDKNTIEKGQGRGSVPTGMNASLSESPRERGLRQGRKCRRSTDTELRWPSRRMWAHTATRDQLVSLGPVLPAESIFSFHVYR